MRSGFRRDKAVEVILYIISKGCRNMYNILKVIYFADKKRVSVVGSTMFKESYSALQAGAVPSGAYDLMKAARDEDSGLPFAPESADSYMFEASRKPDMGLLSRIDVEALDEAIKQFGDMPYDELKAYAHEQPDYVSAERNRQIVFDEIVKSVDDANGSLAGYLKSI